MNIAVILDTFPKLSETFIVREILALRKAGFSVFVYALRKPANPATDPETAALAATARIVSDTTACQSWIICARQLVAHPVRSLAALLRIAALLPRDFIGSLRLARALPAAVVLAHRARHDGIARVHAHFATVPADVGLLMARLLNVPFSFSAHARDIYVRPGAALPWKIRQATFVVACTEHGRERLLKLAPGTPSNKIVTIHHGVFPETFNAAKPEPDFVLAIGRLVPKKGFHVLVDACRILKERGTTVQTAIVGNGPEADRLKEQTERFGLADRVAWLGEKTFDELSPSFQRARMLVLPSVEAPDGDRDGIANVLIEAMAQGVPVIATTASAASEAIEDGIQGFLIPPENSVALADRMERLLRTPDLAARMGQAGRQRVAERFDIGNNAKTLAKQFRNT